MLATPTKPAIHAVTTSPGALKNNVKKEDGGKAEESGLSADQLVPDYAAGLVIGMRFFFCVKHHHLRVLCFTPDILSDIFVFPFVLLRSVWPTGRAQECI